MWSLKWNDSDKSHGEPASEAMSFSWGFLRVTVKPAWFTTHYCTMGPWLWKIQQIGGHKWRFICRITMMNQWKLKICDAHHCQADKSSWEEGGFVALLLRLCDSQMCVWLINPQLVHWPCHSIQNNGISSLYLSLPSSLVLCERLLKITFIIFGCISLHHNWLKMKWKLCQNNCF